jgi:hypothetical protein
MLKTITNFVLGEIEFSTCVKEARLRLNLACGLVR